LGQPISCGMADILVRLQDETKGGRDRRDTPNSKSHCSMPLQPLLSATVDSVDLDESLGTILEFL